MSLSAFELQVNELLREVVVDYSKAKIVESALGSLRTALTEVPEKLVDASLASSFIDSLGAPADKVSFTFRRPQVVDVIGSFSLQTVAKPLQNVDVAVEIPKACFHEKDFLNHRYHAKRALYLAALARHLRKSCPAFRAVKWALFRHDPRCPILVLEPAPNEQGIATKFVIRIFPTISATTLDLSKLSPQRNNVRDAKSNAGELQPTPKYNMSILDDVFLQSHTRLLQSRLASCPSMREAVILLKVWAGQRRFHQSPDSFNGFLLSVLVSHLATPAGGARVGPHMTALQIFRVVMDVMAKGQLLSKGIFLAPDTTRGEDEAATAHDLSSSEARKVMEAANFPCIVNDPSGRLNVAWRVSRSALVELKHEAAVTFRALSGEGGRTLPDFSPVFLSPVDLSAKFDYAIRVDADADVDGLLGRAKTGAASPSPHCTDEARERAAEARVEAILSRALTDRAALVRASRRILAEMAWDLEEGFPPLERQPVLVGVLLAEGEAALRMADVGPSPEDKEEARKFRSFWGSRAELRRFKDGKITETAVWECHPTQRHLIIQKIVEHVLERHAGMPPQHVQVSAGQLDFALTEHGADPAAATPHIIQAFEDLSRRLRSVSDIPLAVVSVQPLSPALRHTDPFPPQPHPLAREEGTGGDVTTGGEMRGRRKISDAPANLPRCLPVLEVLVQLEGSGKWPDAPEAVKRTKLAFAIKIAESLAKKHGLHFIASQSSVDVLSGGFAFRLSVLYEKDRTRTRPLTQRKAGVPGPVGPAGARRSQPEPVPLEDDHLLRSLHASTLAGLDGQFPAFGPTARLAKRWVAAHMFSGVLREEAVELLVARSFVHPAPFAPPRSRMAGLVRFLSLLATHDWAAAPLIVDVNKDFGPEDNRRVQAAFEAERAAEADPGGSAQVRQGPLGSAAMYVATPYDPECATWTRESPDPPTLKRLVAYARSSALLLGRLIVGGDAGGSWKSLFRTPHDVFDLTAVLRPDALPAPHRTLFPTRLPPNVPPAERGPGSIRVAAFKQQGGGVLTVHPGGGHDQLLIGFDPVQILVSKLKARVGSLGSLWFDGIGGDVIGMCWHPHVVKEHQEASASGGKTIKGKQGKRKRKQEAAANGQKSLDSLFEQVREEIMTLGRDVVEVVNDKRTK